MVRNKINNYCELPDKIDMTSYYDGVEVDKDLHFDLTGMIIHQGSSEIGHYYSISSFSYFPKGSSDKRQISNFKVWFENNLLKRIEYTCLGDTFTYEYSDFGDTEVELPENYETREGFEFKEVVYKKKDEMEKL